MAGSTCKSVLFCAGMLLIAPGCRDGNSGIQATQEPQSAVFYVSPAFAFANVVNQVGDEVRMPDGKQLVMDLPTLEGVVLPVTSGQRRAGFERDVICVDADVRIEWDSIVTGVVQDPEGGADEVGKEYWVLRIDKIRTAEWCPVVETAQGR